MEFIVWDPAKPDSAGCTGVRYKVIEAEGQKVLFAGEYDGQIYIYNMGDLKASRTLSDNSKEQHQPTRVSSIKMEL
jgi:hypothetical protein